MNTPYGVRSTCHANRFYLRPRAWAGSYGTAVIYQSKKNHEPPQHNYLLLYALPLPLSLPLSLPLTNSFLVPPMLRAETVNYYLSSFSALAFPYNILFPSLLPRFPQFIHRAIPFPPRFTAYRHPCPRSYSHRPSCLQTKFTVSRRL